LLKRKRRVASLRNKILGKSILPITDPHHLAIIRMHVEYVMKQVLMLHSFRVGITLHVSNALGGVSVVQSAECLSMTS
jgi:hypothetical protein